MSFEKKITSQGQALYTQLEFDRALSDAKAVGMAAAIQATKQAMYLERKACAQMLMDMADAEDEGEVCTAMRNAAQAVMRRGND